MQSSRFLEWQFSPSTYQNHSGSMMRISKGFGIRKTYFFSFHLPICQPVIHFCWASVSSSVKWGQSLYLQHLRIKWDVYTAKHIICTWGCSEGLLLPIVFILYDCVFSQWGILYSYQKSFISLFITRAPAVSTILGNLHRYKEASHITTLMNYNSELPKRWTKSFT